MKGFILNGVLSIRCVNLHWSFGSITIIMSSIRYHGELTMHSILNFTSHEYNFVNKYMQSDIWTEPLLLPA